MEAERDQLPLWLPVSIGLGIAAWFVLPDSQAWRAWMFGTAGLAIGLAVLRPGRRWAHAAAIFALGLALGCALVWAKSERVAAPRLERPVLAEFTARVLAVEPQPAHERTRLILAPIASTVALPPRLRVNLADDPLPPPLAPGMRIVLRARLMPPAPPSVPGGYDFARAAWFAGLGATGKVLELRPVDPLPAQGQGFDELRRQLATHIRQQVAGGAGGIAAALATGDTGGIDEDDSNAMRRAGLAHLLSISGLHVTAVVGAAMWLTIRLLALSPRLALRWPLPLIAAGAGAATGIGYTLLTGAEVPTVRSCVAALLVIAGIALGREAITLRLVAAGALVVLLCWPESLVGPSFQLSFAAVTAIVALHRWPLVRGWLGPREEGIARRTARQIAGLLLTGLLVEATLAPIAAFHFHKAGLYGAFANIIAIPLTTFIVMPLEALALLLDLAGIGAPAWWLAGQSLGLLLWLAHRVAAAPGAVAAVPGMPAGAFALMIGGGLWLYLWHGRVARLGLVPLAIGAAWALATPAPDIIITGDGRHLAVVDDLGRLRLLRDRAGDYVQDLLGEAAGTGDSAVTLEGAADARCSEDLCATTVRRGGRSLAVLATRSAYPIPWRELAEVCARADLAVSDRRLPRGCAPRWLKADRTLLARTGGLAITVADGRVQTVARPGDRHPWIVPPAAAAAR